MTIRVFVGHLSYQVREKDIDRFFKGYGRVGDIHLKNGFGFVEFEDQRDAEDAIADLNGKKLLGESISVELAHGSRRGGEGGYRGGEGGYRGGDSYRGGRRPMRRSPPSQSRYGPPSRTEYQLTVENLSSRVSWQDLKDFMRQAGEVTYADAHKIRQNEGVVEFATYSDMKNALEKLDNMDLSGRKIRLVEGRKRSDRSRSRSRSRSHSRSGSSRSRSRSRSRTPSRSRSRTPTKRHSRSRSNSKGRDKSRSRSWTPEKRRERSKSPGQDRDNGPDK